MSAQHDAVTANLDAARAKHAERRAEHVQAVVTLNGHREHSATASADAVRLQRELANVIANGGDESARSTLRNQVSDAKTVAEHHANEATRIAPTIAALKAGVEQGERALLSAQRDWENSEFVDAKAAYAAALPSIIPAAQRLTAAVQRTGRTSGIEFSGLMIDLSKPNLFGEPVDLSGAFDADAPITILPR
ncbi:UNVERIFIED_ORG: hypothetical protein ABIC54_001624 [Burkholderia sp. 1263]